MILDEHGACTNPHCLSNQKTLSPPQIQEPLAAMQDGFSVAERRISSFSDLLAVEETREILAEVVIPQSFVPSGMDGIEDELTPTALETPVAKRPPSRRKSGTHIRLDALLASIKKGPAKMRSK